ncbi:unnamed protein product [Adineta steineri]|uniref:Helicase/UvrB N-terminal domain-containing protein n=1 Tax=Adineta steineri TaxID=433720 RepID=A0A814MNH1_9BILA|nr:unnamed protein product [Adineta steineri]CAF1078879.1 unnamed protein product [Adineta steineri]
MISSSLEFDNNIALELFTTNYKHSRDFLFAIAENIFKELLQDSQIKECRPISTEQLIIIDQDLSLVLFEVIQHKISINLKCLILLDEVHTALAKSFRKILSTAPSLIKFGLGATLVHEEDKI